jgi:hypothetical protein
MIATIHQPEHLPWLGFCDKMRQADVFVLLDTTQFAKDDFQNRNRIKTDQGPMWLTVPVYKQKRSKQLILDVKICNDRNWGNRCWSLIQQYYRNAPYFQEYAPFFKTLYQKRWDRLVELNEAIILYLKDKLGLQTLLIRASDLGVYEKGGTAVNLAICKAVGADLYLSGKFGQGYLDESQFEEAGIELVYQDFKHPQYQQLAGEFLPRMAFIDLLFNAGEESLPILERANRHAIPSNTDRVAVYPREMK